MRLVLIEWEDSHSASGWQRIGGPIEDRALICRSAGWLIFDGVVTLVLAVMIWATWPSSSAWVLGVLIGVSMFFSGISRLMLTLGARRTIAGT